MARLARQTVTAKTASTYTVVFPGDHGRIITNRGGGALTVTLPEPTTALTGSSVEFFQVAAGDFIVGTTAGEAMVTYNNATADSILFGTDNEEIGNGCRVVCDGTSWLVIQYLGSETATVTVTDA